MGKEGENKKKVKKTGEKVSERKGGEWVGAEDMRKCVREENEKRERQKGRKKLKISWSPLEYWTPKNSMIPHFGHPENPGQDYGYGCKGFKRLRPIGSTKPPLRARQLPFHNS